MKEVFVGIFAFFIAVTGVHVATGHEVKVGHITINHPWSRPAPAGGNAVVYASIVNSGYEADQLISVKAPIAEKAEVHRSVSQDGVHRMEKYNKLTIPAGSKIALEPGGFHVMLVRLKNIMMVEESLPVTFVFRDAGEIKTTFSVEGGHNATHNRESDSSDHNN